MTADRAIVDQVIAQWSPRPRRGATMMIAKYGSPQKATSKMLIWHNQSPFKRITIWNEEVPHDFPKPHVDFLELAIS